MQRNRVSKRMWLIIILIGFAGQIAWMVENMYLNTYIEYLNATTTNHFDYQRLITTTVSVSAAVATVTTVFMGAVIDKIKHKKLFISLGYIIWGIATASFGLFNQGSGASFLKITTTALFSAIMVVVIDAVMTMFGSTANDAAFNSYVTSEIDNKNRGKVEGVLAIMPLLAVLFITIALNHLTTIDSGYRWDLFFYVIGGIVTIVGILALILIPKEINISNTENKNVFKNIIYGFKPSAIKKNKTLYFILITYFVFALSNQIFFPQLLIYIEQTCKIPNSGGLITPFAIVFALSIFIGSIATVVIGYLGDKKGKSKTLFPTIFLYCLGLALMAFIPLIPIYELRLVYGIFSAIIMMIGFISGPAMLNAYLRQYIPKGKEGSFLGVRMIFVVLLPMVIGSNLAEGITKAHNLTRDINGHLVVIPSPLIFVTACGVGLILFFLARKLLKSLDVEVVTKDEKKNSGYLYTINDRVGKDIHLSDYPRPYLKRDSFLSLNGLWSFDIKKEILFPSTLKQKINVPYCVESPLSGIEKLVDVDDYLFYEREVELKEGFNKGRLILHFDGVDHTCLIYINKQYVTTHSGGFEPFSIELDSSIGNKFTISLIVKDVTDSSYHSVGKQRLKPNGWFYSSISGVYFPIWIESVPQEYISNVKFIPDYDSKQVKCLVSYPKKAIGYLTYESKTIQFVSNEEFVIDLKDDFKPWSVESPNLYYCDIKVGSDSIKSYFALRKIEIREENNSKQIYLNNKKIFLNGLLDQGYYFLGNYTPSSFSDYKNDILNAKRLGFNTLRKHVKIEHEMFYYYADVYGMLIIQDFPNGGENYSFLHTVLPRFSSKFNNYFISQNPYEYFARSDINGRREFNNEIDTWTNNLYHHPSIVIYTIFNEGWGEFDPIQIYTRLKNSDPSRLYDTTSGWSMAKDKSDFFSIHSYSFLNLKRNNKYNKAYILSEYGGLGYKVKDNYYYNTKKEYGHKLTNNIETLTKNYIKLFNSVIKQKEKRNLVGAIYTQLNDCESEINGLYTFDRKVLKIDEKIIIDLNSKLN